MRKWLCLCLACATLCWVRLPVVHGALPEHLARALQSIWEDDRELNATDVELLRQEAWHMFDEGFTNYMQLAFPKDNLLPISCKGEDWQGGMAVTLLDSLDSLLLLGRLGDMRSVLPLIKQHVSFDARDIKVHVFEVVIRVLGGLLSAHSLLDRTHDALPDYQGELLQLATQLADRLWPAFKSPTGLPFQFTNLQRGPIKEMRTTCTACAGTLLLEYGTLSALTGDVRWRQAAEHAANLLFQRRSSLGLVGSSLDVATSSWVTREATIGPGTDSFYEYMIKAYLMFGNQTHLDMFTELYISAMRHLQLPGTLRGYAFLADVHMDSGRMARPFVSSLGAFWPAMQALVGQVQDAVELHANFTAAWQTWGWLPELFGLDLSRVHPEDPGYNLRPEHIESTYVLHALTGKPLYLKTAARMQRTLRVANKAKCGYASVANVETGAHIDLQESFFLSETVKYLYLTFSPGSQHLLDYYILSTEGHILPTFPAAHAAQEEEEAGLYAQVVAQGPPANCLDICEPIDPEEQAQIEQQLRHAFPLLAFRRADAAAIRRRRCIACAHVTRHMQASSRSSTRNRILQLTAELQLQADAHAGQPAAEAREARPLAQVVCVLAVTRSGRMSCTTLRPLTQHDLMHGLPHNAVVLQLSWAEASTQRGLLMVTPITPDDKASLLLPAGTATFGASLLEITPACFRQLLNTTAPWLEHAAQTRGRTLCPPSVRQTPPSSSNSDADSLTNEVGSMESDESDDASSRVSFAWEWGDVMRGYKPTCAPLRLPELAVPAGDLIEQLLATQRNSLYGQSCAMAPPAKQQADSAPQQQQPQHSDMQQQQQQSKQVAVQEAEDQEDHHQQQLLQQQHSMRQLQQQGQQPGAGAEQQQQRFQPPIHYMMDEPDDTADLSAEQEEQQQPAVRCEPTPKALAGLELDLDSLDPASGVCDKLAAVCLDVPACAARCRQHGRHRQLQAGPPQLSPALVAACYELCRQVPAEAVAAGSGSGTGAGHIGMDQAGSGRHTEEASHGHGAGSDGQRPGAGLGQGGVASGQCNGPAQSCVWDKAGGPGEGQAYTEQHRQHKAANSVGDGAPAEPAQPAAASPDAATAAPPAGPAVLATATPAPPASSSSQPEAAPAGVAAAGESGSEGAGTAPVAAPGPCVSGEADLSWLQQEPHATGACRHVPVTYGEMVLADPPHACGGQPTNAGQLAGNIAVVVRGGCSFQAKAMAVQAAGANGLVVLNLQGGEELVSMSGDAGVSSNMVRIPALLLGTVNARLLLRALGDAAARGLPRPVATLVLDHPALRSGLHTAWQQQGAAATARGPAAGAGAPGADGTQGGQDKAGPGGGGAQWETSRSTRVELLVPTTSHEFIRARVMGRGHDLQASMDQLMTDDRIMLLLMQVAKENEAAQQAEALSRRAAHRGT